MTSKSNERAARAAAWLVAVSVSLALCACGTAGEERSADARSADARNGDFALVRRAMVERQIAARGIDDEAVLAALRAVPRHRFVPAEFVPSAYDDRPLPIGLEQTISQPYVVAFMTAAAELDASDRVLEVGTGSGYQAAVLAEIVGELWSIEIVAPLAERARRTLADCGYSAVHVRTGDGYRGWPEEAPFDAILVTAAPDHVPQPLLDQLAVGGRLVIPVGDSNQAILRIRRTATSYEHEELLDVRFVPMTGEALERR